MGLVKIYLRIFYGFHSLEPHPSFEYLPDDRVVISSGVSIKFV